MLRFRSLGSGSSGNATVIECKSAAHTKRLLVDCGLKLKQLHLQLDHSGLRASDLDGIFITHEHSDHIGCALSLAKQYQLPVWASRGTWAALGHPDLGSLYHTAFDAAPIALGDLVITPFTVPHDAREPLQLTCTDGERKLGILTDLGHASMHVLTHLADCTGLLLECNHDLEMLRNSSYPTFLKQRVAGRMGHLCNADAAALLAQIAHTGLHTVVAAHLSQQNNRPHLALAALASALSYAPTCLQAADAEHGTPWLQL